MTRLLRSNPKTSLILPRVSIRIGHGARLRMAINDVGIHWIALYLLKTNNWKTTALYSFTFFLGYFLTGLYWISSSLFVDLAAWWWALPFSFVGLPIILALFPTIIISCLFLIKKYRFAVLIIGLVIADIARGYIFTGFPWNYPVHTWAKNNLVLQLLPFLGLYGLNALTILCFALPALLKPKYRYIYGALIIIVTMVPVQDLESKNTLPNSIILVQANIPQKEKWNPDLVWRNFDRYVDMTQSAISNDKAQIIIWPETAISENF